MFLPHKLITPWNCIAAAAAATAKEMKKFCQYVPNIILGKVKKNNDENINSVAAMPKKP